MNIKKISIAALMVLFIIICILGTDFYFLWLPLEHSPEYPAKVAALFMAVTALVTLFLAFATFSSIEQSNLREKARREEDERIRNEERESNFKRRCLSDIEDWAEKSIIFLNQLELNRGGYTTQWYKSALQPFTLKSKWMMDASRIFAEDDKKALLKAVDKAVAGLEEYRTGKTVRDIIFMHEELVTSLNKVLACIADLKAELKL